MFRMYASSPAWPYRSQLLLFLLLMQPALDAGQAAAEGRQLLAQAAAAATGPAAPRVQLSFQLAGYSSNASLAEAIKGSLMPTAVKVLQKLFQVRRVHSTPAVCCHVQHDAMRVACCFIATAACCQACCSSCAWTAHHVGSGARFAEAAPIV
jgi:hypothetical protein